MTGGLEKAGEADLFPYQGRHIPNKNYPKEYTLLMEIINEHVELILSVSTWCGKHYTVFQICEG